MEAELTKFSKYVVSQSRANLTRGKKNVNRNLWNSISGKVFVGANSIGLYFYMEKYGQFQDEGVQGATSTKAPNSPFRFGASKGMKRSSGGLRDSIEQWVKDRKIQFRDRKSGRFLSYESTAFLISRSVWNKGIAPSRFFTNPFEKGFENLPNDIVKKFGLTTEIILKQSLKK